MSRQIEFNYKVKCRNCNKIVKMWHSKGDESQLSYFKIWASEHSIFPIQKQCECDNGSMMFHDLVSYSPMF